MAEDEVDKAEEHAPPPLPVVPLNYLSPKENRRMAQSGHRLGIGGEMVLGFLAWVAGIAILFAVIQSQRPSKAGIPIAAILITHAAMAGWLYYKNGWKGYLPGLLIGFGITCLVPIGIVWVVCGNWK